jgi:hypothetical protein
VPVDATTVLFVDRRWVFIGSGALRVCEMSVGQQSWVVVDGVLRGP